MPTMRGIIWISMDSMTGEVLTRIPFPFISKNLKKKKKSITFCEQRTKWNKPGCVCTTCPFVGVEDLLQKGTI